MRTSIHRRMPHARHVFDRATRSGLAALAASAGVTSTAAAQASAAGTCNRLLVTHPVAQYSGLYAATTDTIHGAPVYRMEDPTVPEGSRYQYLYIYRHLVGGTPAGSEWVLQPITPDPSRYQADVTGEGETPWSANWRRGVQIVCDASQKRSADDASVIDMLALYTPAAIAAAGSEEAVRLLIRRRLDALNNTFVRSKLPYRVEPAYIGRVDYDEGDRARQAATEAGQSKTWLYERIVADFWLGGENNPRISETNARVVDEVHRLRKVTGADLVSVHVAAGGGPCGIGRFAVNENRTKRTYPDQAYSIVRVRCESVPGLALAHEFGHNLGLRHDRETDGLAPDFDSAGYNYGYITPDRRYVTIMGYLSTCGSRCSSIPYWSSPTSRYEYGDCANGQCRGGPFVGTATADNRRALQDHFPLVAAFLPRAPRHFMHADSTQWELDVGEQVRIPFRVFNAEAIAVPILRVYARGGAPFELELDLSSSDACREGASISPAGACSGVLILKPVQATRAGFGVVFVQMDPAGPLGLTVHWTAR